VKPPLVAARLHVDLPLLALLLLLTAYGLLVLYSASGQDMGAVAAPGPLLPGRLRWRCCS
jgi:rod shape determining protein RodA